MVKQKTWKKWTSKEEKVLSSNVKHCLTLYNAFELTAEKTGRTHNAVSQHYYKNKHVLTFHNKEGRLGLSKLIALVRNIFIF